MKITCPSCSAKLVNSSKNSILEGKLLKCEKCKYLWRHHEKSKLSNYPLKTYHKNFSETEKSETNFYYIFIQLLFLASLSIIFASTIKSQNNYKQYLKLNNISLSKNNGEDNTTILHYNITNLSNKNILLPAIELNIYDKNNKLITKNYIKKKHFSIKGNFSVHVKTEFLKLPQNASILKIILTDKNKFILLIDNFFIRLQKTII